MTIEKFSKEQFENALPSNERTQWEYLGFMDGEETYLVTMDDGRVKIQVRSSIDATGYAADTGEDSIRAWLVADDLRPLGSKVAKWTTRVPGWEDRLQDVMRTLWQWRTHAGDCPTCNVSLKIFKVKKSQKNIGRPFAKCTNCNYFRGFVDEKPRVDAYWANGHLEDDQSQPENEGELIEDNPVERTPVDFLGEDIEVAFEEDVVAQAIVEPKHKLNPQQEQAVSAPLDAVVRVLAPPGSGKTVTLVQRYVHLLENGVSPTNIVAVTFSKAMADELLKKISGVYPSVLGTDAENQICTIHALCYRLLKMDGDTRNLAKEWEVKKVLNEIAEELWLEPHNRPGYKEIWAWIDTAKARNISAQDDVSFYQDALGSFHGPRLDQARYQFDQRMRGKNLLTFADMLFDIEQKLASDPIFRAKYQARFQYVMQDEGQDANSQDWRILSILAEPQDNLFVVGDVDQMLYGFRGARPENLLNSFDKRYPDAVTVKLVTNYRSTQTIIEKCQRLIEHNYSDSGGKYDQVYMKDVRSRDGAPIGDPINFSIFQRVEDEASALVDGITELFADNSYNPGDIFVGARTRAQLGYLEGALVKAQIPFVNIAGGSFWTSKHVADVIGYLRLAYNEHDNEAFERVYNIASNYMTFPWKKSPRYGQYINHRFLGREFLGACENSYTKTWLAVSKYGKFQPGVEDLVGFVRDLQSVLDKGAEKALRFILTNCYEQWMKADEGIVTEDEAENGKISDLETVIEIASSYDDVGEFLAYVREMIEVSRKASEKDLSEVVVISTVHRLKGLERKVVFGVGISEGWEYNFPSPYGLLPHTFSKSMPPQFGILPTGGQNSMEDERSIMFVLVSRAMEKVFLSGVQEYREKPMGESRFVQEMLDETS